MKKPIIQFEHYGFKYRSQVEQTLYDINLTIYEGEKILIVGPSGSGKSTLAHCINGLVPFSFQGEAMGTLKIDGKDVRDEGIFTRSKLVGTVLQDPDGQFIGLTVAEDIAFSLENDGVSQEVMAERVVNVSKMVEMEGFLSQSIHKLSGGQKQRVGLAGVMVDDVKILLFDEPLANLDPATGKQAITLIDQIQKEINATVIIIEHRLEDVLYEDVDRIIVVDNGRIVSDSSPDILLAGELLEKSSIREPLYVKALKYAGCKVTAEMKPHHVESIELEGCKKKVVDWFENAEFKEPMQKTEPLFELENIFFGYEKKKPVLCNVSISISKGEIVSIVGKNGAGKSTLSKLICGFERPNSGRILMNGLDISNETIKERALRIGMVMQNPNQMISKHLIYDEVALGLVLRGVKKAEINERVDETLKICGLYPFRNWPISALSFGQKKRVTIASILVLQPEIIILDEPTAGQDYRHYTDIMKFLTKLNEQGLTVIIITHDMHVMLEYSHRAIVIANGKKIADDVAVKILGNEEVIRKANLKETSLFQLAKRVGIENQQAFVQQFISFEKEASVNEDRNAVLS